MPDYIKCEDVLKFPIRRSHHDEHADPHFINGIETVMEYIETLPAVPAPDAEQAEDCPQNRRMAEAYLCIADLWNLLDQITTQAKQRDLSLLRVRGGAQGADCYMGLPPICRIFDELLDRHGEAIHTALLKHSLDTSDEA